MSKMQEMVSQGPKFSLALFMPSSYFKHKTEVTVADKLHFFATGEGAGGGNRVLLSWFPAG